MNRGGAASVLSGSLRTLFGVGTLSGLTDGQLLERYLRGRAGVGEAVAEAEAAFAGLVERHGPMVLNVCRAVLGDRHDAEDACQATFLVLARRAEWIRRGDSVASWLYGVARRIAARARRDLARRRELERHRLERTRSSDLASAPTEPWPELYEELDRLPEPFRAAVVLCDLEGHSYEQAAGLLSCPVGTIQSRLARGRARLRRRLERRGIAPAVAIIGIGTEQAARSAAVALSPPLTAAIARAAIAIGAGRTIAGAAPAAVAALAGTEIRRQVMNRLATTVTTLLVAGSLATAAIGLAAGGRGVDPRVQPPAAVEKKAATGPVHVRVVDLDGDAAAGVPVEWRAQGRAPRSFTTGADGRLTIPRELFGDSSFLVSWRGRDGIAWARMSDPDPNRPPGTEEAPIVMELLPTTHRVEGSVVDRAGRPVAGAELRLFALDHPVNGNIFFETILQGLLDRVSTDQGGRYAIALPRGAHAILHAAHPRYVGSGVAVPPDTRTAEPEILEPAGSIVGRVTDAATGRPIAGAFLGAQLVEHRTRILSSVWVEATSDDQGRFVLGGAEPGVYNVLFNGIPGRPGATARAVECVRVRAGVDTPADLTVIEGRPLRGVVVDRDTGEPVPGIEVGCYGPARPRSGAAVESRRADDLGRFLFHVPPGEQYVYLQEGDIGYRLSRQTIVVPEQGKIELVRLMRRPPRNQGMLGMMAAVKGVAKVAEPPPAEPAKAEVVEEVKVAGPNPEPAVGKAMMKAEAYTKAVEPAAPRARPDQARVPAVAPKVRTVTGRVRDLQGRPLAGVSIGVSIDFPAPDGRFEDFGHPATDRDGLFIFPDLPRRPLRIILGHPGYRNQTEDLPADRDEAQWTFGLIPDSEAKGRPGPPQDEPIPPGHRARLTFIDLDPRGTDDLIDGPGYTSNDLSRLPRGIHKLGETYFRIGEEMVHVQGRMRTDLPQSVKGIAVGARGRVLHFLHAAQYAAEPGEMIGAYVVHYADGTSEQIPLVCGRHLVDWWAFDRSSSEPTEAKVAWTGSNDNTDQNKGLKIRLFDFAWTNPHPEKEIATLDVLSAGKQPDPFLVAVTLERP